jgi:hypothetical protein
MEMPMITGRKTMVVLAGFVALSALATSTITALAADPYSSIATAEQRRACTPDVYRLCAGEIPSVPAITACLRRKKASLSEACRAVFEQ